MSAPELGVIFPCRDIGDRREDLLNFAPNAEEAGATFLVAYDHVLGIPPEQQDCRAGIENEVTENHSFHEPMVLFGAMAARTEHIQLMTGVMVGPQRPTSLIAKQAAEVDILSGGRLVLGMGIGWNRPEFEAMGYDFATRALRFEEQVRALREIWTGSRVTGNTSLEHMEGASIRPRPIQQPIPIYVGGLAAKAITRAAEIGDGWIPLGYIGDEMDSKIDHFRAQSARFGHDNLPIVGRVNPYRDSDEACLRQVERWQQKGVSHVALGSSMDAYTESSAYFDKLHGFLELLNRVG